MIESTNTAIETLEIERQLALDRAKTIGALAKDSERTLSSEEMESQGKYLDRVESIDSELSTLNRIEELEAKRAVKIEPDAASSEPSAITVGSKVREPGIIFAQMAVALKRNQGSRSHAAEFARSEWDDDFLARILETPPGVLDRAAVTIGDTTTTGYATELVNEYARLGNEFIDLLRPLSVLPQIQPRRLAFGDNSGITIPKLSAGVSGGWVSESGAIPVNAFTTAQITMAPAKLGVITVISQELVNTSNPAALSVIRDDMVRGTANTIDTLFISATAASAPAPAGILNGVTGNTASTATLDLDKAIADLKGMADDLVGADVPGPYVWIMNSAQHNSLLYMTDTVAGGFAFRNELASGTLMGHRVVVSNNVAAATVILVAESQILWATGRAPEITLSNEATIHLDTAPDSNLSGATGGEVTSMFQTDSVASKLITSLTWARRHDEAVSYVTSVGW